MCCSLACALIRGERSARGARLIVGVLQLGLRQIWGGRSARVARLIVGVLRRLAYAKFGVNAYLEILLQFTMRGRKRR